MFNISRANSRKDRVGRPIKAESKGANRPFPIEKITETPQKDLSGGKLV